MQIETGLFDFAYIPDWQNQLNSLKDLALPESWQFKENISNRNTETTILERYINAIFKKQSLEYNWANDEETAQRHFHINNQCACFHTGLYTKHYKGIYGYFGKNKRLGELTEWYFQGFFDENSSKLRYIEPLPEKPNADFKQSVIFNPELPIRVNVDHILCDAENLERIPAEIREAKNLPLLLETSVELARRQAIIAPGIIVPQAYQGNLQFLMPLCLTNMETPDLAMTLQVMDGYYLGNTCLTLDMAYTNARTFAKPVAPWLTNLLK